MGNCEMDKFLHIKLFNKKHAYPDAPGAQQEVWGRIILFYQSGETAVILVDTEWDLLKFAEWYITNKQFLFFETLSAPGDQKANNGESIAEAIARLTQTKFLEKEEDVEFQWFDYLYQFSSRHNLWNSLMGSKIPNILLGRNHNFGEISFYSNSKKWSYEFNLSDFKEEVEQEIAKFLLFHKNSSSTELHNRIDVIINGLGRSDLVDCCKDLNQV